MVYIREAHPEDGWQVPMNETDEVVIFQHRSFAERTDVAKSCALDLRYTFPVLVDDMDNTTDEAYVATPERLYLIGEDGNIAYRGGPGPFLFDPEEWEQAIVDYLDKKK